MTPVPLKRAVLYIALALSGQAEQSFAQTKMPAPQEQALAVKAEQAFAKLNYEETFQLGQQVLTLNPRNSVIRRLTAAAAFQLGRSGDCLRLMSGLPPTEVTSDDVHTIGGCSEQSKSFSPALIRFLESSKADPARSDAASYWLGLIAYRNGRFSEAKVHFEKALVLPSKLAEQKRFMLERVDDVLAAQKANAPAKEISRTNDKSQETRPIPQKTVARDLIPRREAKNGLFTSFEGDASIGAGLGAINEISTLTGRQQAFDEEVEKSILEKRDLDASTITVSDGVLVTPLSTFATDVVTGYRSGNFIENLGTEYALDLKLSASYSKLKGAAYSVQGTKMHPAGLLAFPTAGAGARVGGHIEWRLGPSFRARTELFSERLAVNLDEQYGQSGGQGTLTLGSGSFAVSFKGFWHLMQGDDLVLGGHWNGFDLDLELINLGFFTLKAPAGHSLISYQVSAPIPDSRTTGVFQIVSTEGKYFEINIAPAVVFNPYFKSQLWYRFVSGTERSYISSVTKKRQIEQDDFGVKYPDSQYDSSLSELSAVLEYTPWSWGGIRSGVSAIFYGTRYHLTDVPPNPSAPENSPALYSKLLDRGAQNATLAFGTLYARF